MPKPGLRAWLSLVFALLLVAAPSRGEVATGRRSNAQRNSVPAETVTGTAHPRGMPDDPPLPETVTLRAKGKKVEDIFEKVIFSEKVKPGVSDKMVVGEDPMDAYLRVVDEMLARVKSGKTPKEKAHVEVTIYHLADERWFDRFKEAKRLGITIGVTTDANDSMTVDFKAKETQVGNPELAKGRGKPNGSENGKFLKRLIALGGEWATPTGKKAQITLYTQPIFNKRDENGEKSDKMFDILHEKAVVVWEAGDQPGEIAWAKAVKGSANATAHGVHVKLTGDTNALTRVNISRVIQNQDLAKEAVAHAHALQANCAAGNTIAKIPEQGQRLLRVETDNGWVESGYTNGRHNLNDRDTAFILLATPGVDESTVEQKYGRGVKSYYDRLAPEFKGWKITDMRGLNFVNTYGRGNIAKGELFRADPNVKSYNVTDAKFNDVVGFGYTPIEYGNNVVRPMGGVLISYPKDLAARMKNLIYLRGIPGVEETDPDGAPIARYLMHMKTSIRRGVLPDGTPVTVIFDGSFNYSNHDANAEDQDVIVFKGKSPLADDYFSLVERLAAAQSQYLTEGFQYLVHSTFARMTNNSPLRISFETAAHLRELVEKGDAKGVKAELQQLAATAKLRRFPKAKVGDWIDRVEKYLEWHKENYPWQYQGGDTGEFYLRHVIEVPALMTNPKVEPTRLAFDLSRILWARDLTPEQIQSRMKEVWEMMGRTDPMPPPPTRRTPSREPTPTGHSGAPAQVSSRPERTRPRIAGRAPAHSAGLHCGLNMVASRKDQIFSREKPVQRGLEE